MSINDTELKHIGVHVYAPWCSRLWSNDCFL